MKKILSAALVSAGLLFASCSGGGSGEKVLLRLTPEAGTARKMTVSISMDMSSMMGMKTDMVTESEIEIKSVAENGDFEMESTYSRIKMDISSSMMNMSYDSDKDADLDPFDPMAEAYENFNAMLNKPLVFVMNNRGKVVKAPDLNTLLTEEAQNEAAARGQSDQMGQMLDNMFAIFPEEEVKEGDSWEREMDTKSGEIPMSVKVKYTVDKIQADKVILSCAGDISGSGNTQGMSMKLTGTMKGTMELDRKTGWTEKAEITQELEMNMGMKVKMTNKIQITSK